MNSPKQRFQTVATNAAWKGITESVVYEEATDAAMLQFLNNISSVDQTASSKIHGAREFLKCLTDLSKTETPASPKPDYSIRTP